ncbi:hypothetical protein Dimus_006684 [Dionaea muscipula]
MQMFPFCSISIGDCKCRKGEKGGSLLCLLFLRGMLSGSTTSFSLWVIHSLFPPPFHFMGEIWDLGGGRTRLHSPQFAASYGSLKKYFANPRGGRCTTHGIGP